MKDLILVASKVERKESYLVEKTEYELVVLKDDKTVDVKVFAMDSQKVLKMVEN